MVFSSQQLMEQGPVDFVMGLDFEVTSILMLPVSLSATTVLRPSFPTHLEISGTRPSQRWLCLLHICLAYDIFAKLPACLGTNH